MNFFLQLAGHMDEKAFLSFRLWQFSLQNMRRRFFWHYLYHALLKHPIRALAGLMRYCQFVSRSHGAPLFGTIDLPELGKLARTARFLIAPGYCMKPYEYEKGRSICPAGHFNHQCRLLDDAAHLLRRREKWPAPCSRCGIAPLALAAAQMAADVYIMTSAIDIARDLYIPAMNKKAAQYGLFFLCPYSLEPFMFGLATAGIKGVLVAFCRGYCSNHEEWTRADVGYKDEQSFVADDIWDRIMQQLEKMRLVRCYEKQHFYEIDGHVYRAGY